MIVHAKAKAPSKLLCICMQNWKVIAHMIRKKKDTKLLNAFLLYFNFYIILLKTKDIFMIGTNFEVVSDIVITGFFF